MNTTHRSSLIAVILVFLLYCCMAYGNEEEKKIIVEDTTPPVISNVKVFDITATSAKISWETDEPARSMAIWGTTNKLPEGKSITHEEFTTIHSFEITGLSPSTLHYYWTASVDAKINWNVPKPSTFTTQAK